MEPKLRMQTIAITVCATLAACAQALAQEQSSHQKVRFSRYTVIDLGTLGGAASSAFGINNRGHVSAQGNLLGNANEHGFLFRYGTKVDLGTLGGPGLNSTVGTVNDRDEVSMFAETNRVDPFQENFCGFFTVNACVGAVWKHGVVIPLPTLGGNNALAVGVNNRGEVVGWSENGNQDASCPAPQKFDFEAVTWGLDGLIHELPPLKGDTVGFALGLNNRGDVAGGSGTCANTPLFPLIAGPHAVLWENGIPHNLGNLGGTLSATAAAVNDRREVAGGSYVSGDQNVHSFFWTDDKGIQDMGTVAPDVASFATAINEAGQVVGASCDANPNTAQTPPNCRAYLWEEGTMVDLNSLVPSDSPLYMLFAYQINGTGEIVGQACVTSNGECTAELHAFLATPTRKDHDHADDSWEGAESINERPRPYLSEKTRRLLQQQLRQRSHTNPSQ
jgi:probable HAF family extracellular repeat protein